MSKAQLLSDLKDENTHWEALLAEIGEERMTQPGVAGEWTIKDVVAHLAGWRRRTVGRLWAASHHEPEPAPPWPGHLREADEINAWIYESNRDRPLSDVLADSRGLFPQLVAAIETLPEAELMDPNRFDWMGGEALIGAAFYSHFHEEHESDMRAWLAKAGQHAG